MKFADAGMADKKLRLEQFLFVQSSGTGSGAGTAGEKGRSLEMKVFVVVYHPEASSFNQAMFRCAVEALAAAGHEVRSSDLAAMGFDPRPGDGRRPGISGSELELCADPVPGGAGTALEEEIGKIEWCDLMIWQFPLWWFGLPSTFKGWVERCFVQGRIYGGGRFYAEGRFHGRRAMLSLTTGGSEELYRPGEPTVISTGYSIRFITGCSSSSVSRCWRRISSLPRNAFPTPNEVRCWFVTAAASPVSNAKFRWRCRDSDRGRKRDDLLPD